MLSHTYSLWKKYPMKPPLQIHMAKYCAAIQVLENFFNCGDGLTFSNNCLLVRLMSTQILTSPSDLDTTGSERPNWLDPLVLLL